MRPLKKQVSQANQELKTLAKANLTLIDSWFQIPDTSWIESRKKSSGVMIASDGEVVFKPIHIQEKRIDGTKHDVELQVQVCKDKKLLEEYYALRQEVYRTQLGFEGYDGSENEYDRKGDIIVVLRNEKVIAGARLNFSDKTKLMYNDILDKGFLYKNIIKKFDNNFNQNEDLFVEMCGLAVDPSIDDRTLFFKFFSTLLDNATVIGCQYFVYIAYEILGYYVSKVLKKLEYDFNVFRNYKYPIESKNHENKFNLDYYPTVVKLS
jgi:hypothetical protein